MQTAFATKPTIDTRPNPAEVVSFPAAKSPIRPALTGAGGAQGGPVKLMVLPFAHDAMVPQMSRETMEYHYDKHFVGYVDKLNALIRNTAFEGTTLEEMIRHASSKRRHGVLTNASQVWNHAFFWKSLSPEEATGPDAILADAITKQFGSLSIFQNNFVSKGTTHLGSGWLWLVWDKWRGLVVTTTSNATPVWLGADRTPLLVCDLWEHAYYLDWRNDRAGWLHAFITERANWAFAAEQMAALLNGRPQWAYPRD